MVGSTALTEIERVDIGSICIQFESMDSTTCVSSNGIDDDDAIGNAKERRKMDSRKKHLRRSCIVIRLRLGF